MPAPEDYLGFEVGTERRLADWREIVGYFERVAESSDRVLLDTIGRSTLDRPVVLLTVSDPENLSRLDEYRVIQEKLADPRMLADDAERRRLVERGRLVILITSGVHATEVGSAQLPLRLVYRLASSRQPDVLRVLQETIILMVPSVNPDGVQAVTEWYRSTLDMPWEGSPPPFLYHHYVGHDINRDWYAFTQREPRLVVTRVHNVWHPQIVHDVHQQEEDASRFFVPPWADPIEPNVDPLLISATNALGTAIAWSMYRAGKKGVMVNERYDAWSPARAYQHYHAGVRVLSETASARLGTSVEIAPGEIEARARLGASYRSWNLPEPWPGGRWSLEDIVDYMETGAMALLRSAATDRESWLETFVSVGERAVAGWDRWPEAWIIPPPADNELAIAEILRILLTGEVEVSRAIDTLRAAGRAYPPGSYVVDMHQPYASFAQTLLEPQVYPEAFDAQGEPIEPYDVTAHTLPLLFGVEATPVYEIPQGETDPVTVPPDSPPRRAEGLTGAPGILVGLYQPWVPSIDEGWTRWLFDRYEVPYAVLHNQEIRQGDLARRFTAILIPSIEADVLRDGWLEGTQPQEYVGGLDGAAVEALQQFVDLGGTIVGLNRAAQFLIDELSLPVRDRLAGLTHREFYAPGAIAALNVDAASPLAAGMPVRTGAWVEGGGAYEILDESRVSVVASWSPPPTALSGWIHGAARLSGRPAMVDVSVGAGSVVLFGFRPQYRGHSLATFPLLFNSLKRRMMPEPQPSP